MRRTTIRPRSNRSAARQPALGGAIRDPLSGRTYVYQAMRVTGAADPTVSVNETLKGKLPQKKLVREAATRIQFLRKSDRSGDRIASKKSIIRIMWQNVWRSGQCLAQLRDAQ